MFLGIKCKVNHAMLLMNYELLFKKSTYFSFNYEKIKCLLNTS